MRPLFISLLAFALTGVGPSRASAAPDSAAFSNRITGTIQTIKGSMITLETRDKRTVEVDCKPAIDSHRVNLLGVGGFISATGTLDKNGVFHAQTVQRAKKPSSWPPDR